MAASTDLNLAHHDQQLRFGRTTVSVVAGDILVVPAEAIVVPANRRGMMVAGIAGQVRYRSGAEVERDLMRQAPLTSGVSVATSSGDLAARGVRLILHAVVFDDLGGSTRIDIIQRGIGNVLQSADRHRVRSLLMPPLGTGIGEGRIGRDAVYEVMVREVAAHLRRFNSRIDHIIIVSRDQKEANAVFRLVQDAHTLWWRLKTSS